MLTSVVTYGFAECVQVKQTQLLIGLFSAQHEPLREVGGVHILPNKGTEQAMQTK